MAEAHRWQVALECPAIHLIVAAENGVGERLSRWVMFGAEEEGVPCRLVPNGASDVVALALAAAQGSHIGVGVGVAQGKIALHEAHLPEHKPVMVLELAQNPQAVCRLIGSNAGRMVKHMPLRFLEEMAAEEASAGSRKEVSPPEVRSAVIPAFFDREQGLDSGALNQIIERVLMQRGS